MKRYLNFALAMCILTLVMAEAASAKSLYVNRDLSAWSPIRAYDIQPAPNYLVYQEDSANLNRYGGVGLAIDTDSETLFVTFESSATLDIVDAKTLANLGQVATPNAYNLAGIVVDQEKQKVYTVDRGTNHLYVYSWNAVAKTLTNDITSDPYYISLEGLDESVNGGAYGIALDEVHGLLYVGDGSKDVKVFDTSDWSSKGSFAVSQEVHGVAVDVENGLVYTGNAYPDYGSEGLICKYDLNEDTESTCNIRELTGFGDDCVLGLAVDSDTGLLYITTGNQGGGGSDQVMVFDSDLILLHSTGNIGNPTGLCVPGKQVSYNPLNLAKNDTVEGDGVYIGQTFTYEITCDNELNPNNDATNVTILDTLPPELDYISSTIDGVEQVDVYDSSTHTVLWEIGTILAGEAGPLIELVVSVNENAVPGGTIVNYCTIEADDIPPTTVIDINPVIEVIIVDIDIKPGSMSGEYDVDDVISLGMQGLIPLVIFTEVDDEGQIVFDAREVNPETIVIAGMGVAIHGKGSDLMAYEKDVDEDGFDDLLVHVATANFDEGTVQEGEVLLTGSTDDGKPIKGWDYVTVVPIE